MPDQQKHLDMADLILSRVHQGRHRSGQRHLPVQVLLPRTADGGEGNGQEGGKVGGMNVHSQGDRLQSVSFQARRRRRHDCPRVVPFVQDPPPARGVRGGEGEEGQGGGHRGKRVTVTKCSHDVCINSFLLRSTLAVLAASQAAQNKYQEREERAERQTDDRREVSPFKCAF